MRMRSRLLRPHTNRVAMSEIRWRPSSCKHSAAKCRPSTRCTTVSPPSSTDDSSTEPSSHAARNDTGNHTAYKQVKGRKTPANEILELYEGLKQSYLNNFDVLLSGYMPSAEAVQAVGKIGRDLRFNASGKPGSFFWGMPINHAWGWRHAVGVIPCVEGEC